MFCCVFLVIIALALYAFNRNIVLVADRLEVISAFSIESIRSPLQLGDMKAVEQKLQGVMENLGLDGVKLLGPDGSTLVAFGVGNAQLLPSFTYGKGISWKWPFTLLFQHSDSIFHDDKTIGFLITHTVAGATIFIWPVVLAVFGLLCQYALWLLLFSSSEAAETINNKAERTTHREEENHHRNVQERIEELRRERDLAAVSAEAKNTFIARFSHEVRSSLNGVIGALSLLEKSKLDEDRLRLVRAAGRSAGSLLLITDDVLDLARLESGRIEFEKIPFDLRETVEESITLFIDPARKKGLNLHCYMPTGIPSQVVGDPTRFRQILTNFLGNAIKFTDDGEINLLLTTVKREDNRQRLCFTVEDTGIGIDPEKLDSIFEMFVQADASTTRNYGGSGVGLSICKQLVEQQNGEIGARSNPGRGASFWFILEFEIIGEKYSRPQWPQLINKEILLIDNCETCTTIISQYLQDALLTSKRVDDRHDVINQLVSLRIGSYIPEILILDHESLGGETEAVLEKIHSICGESIPSIFVLTWEGDKINARIEAKTSGIITKPVFLFQLCDRLTGISSEPSEETIDYQDEILECSVLLVDDEEINRHVGAEILKKLGCIVDVAENGPEALEKTASFHYDLVLLDVQMPQMSGIEVAEMIRRREQQTGEPRLVIVALTANGLKSTFESCMAAGMDGFIVKPMQLDLLRKELARWLGTDADTTGEQVPALPGVNTKAGMAGNPTEQASWDRGLALRYLGGDEQLLGDLMKMFLLKKDKLLAAIEEAMARRNGEEISSAAHAFKGAVNHFAAGRCRQLAQTIESRAGEECLEDLERLFQSLLDATEDLEKELEREIRDITNA